MREAGSLLAQLGVLKIVKSENIFSLYDEKNVSFYDIFKFQRLVSLLHFFECFKINVLSKARHFIFHQ